MSLLPLPLTPVAIDYAITADTQLHTPLYLFQPCHTHASASLLAISPCWFLSPGYCMPLAVCHYWPADIAINIAIDHYFSHRLAIIVLRHCHYCFVTMLMLRFFASHWLFQPCLHYATIIDTLFSAHIITLSLAFIIDIIASRWLATPFTWYTLLILIFIISIFISLLPHIGWLFDIAISCHWYFAIVATSLIYHITQYTDISRLLLLQSLTLLAAITLYAFRQPQLRLMFRHIAISQPFFDITITPDTRWLILIHYHNIFFFFFSLSQLRLMSLLPSIATQILPVITVGLHADYWWCYATSPPLPPLIAVMPAIDVAVLLTVISPIILMPQLMMPPYAITPLLRCHVHIAIGYYLRPLILISHCCWPLVITGWLSLLMLAIACSPLRW